MLSVLLITCALCFSTQDSTAKPQEPYLLRTYDVRDLAARVGPDFPAPRLGVSTVVAPATSPESAIPKRAELAPSAPDARADEETAKEIAAGSRVLQSFLLRELEATPQDARFQLRCTDAGTLVANVTPGHHHWLDTFFGYLRSYDRLISVEAHFVRLPAERLKELGIEGPTAFPRPEDVPSLLEALKNSPQVEFLSSPRLLTLPLQRANITVLEQLKFVQDWRVETVEPDAQEVLVPQIAQLYTGLALEVRTVPRPDGKLALSIEAQEARLSKPLASTTVKLKTRKGETEVPLALPEVGIQSVQSELLLQDGSTALLVLEGPSGPDDLRLVVAVKAHSVGAK